MSADFQDRLRGIVGVSRVLTQADDVAPFCTDWRGRYTGNARCVVRPGSTEEVAAVVGACADAGASVVPQGGNTGLGGGLGFLAGLTGIGGGIFLSPALQLLRWDSPKVIAATASLFIFCQSAAGLTGQLLRQPAIDWGLVLPLLLAVWVGGQIGVRWSAGKSPQALVRNLTAALVFYAGVTILWRYL